jgi:hypothetical protein
LVIIFWGPLVLWCVTAALTVAVFPFLEEEALFMDHALPGAVVLWEQRVHFEVLPLYVKVALIETDHNTEPDELSTKNIAFFTIELSNGISLAYVE